MEGIYACLYGLFIFVVHVNNIECQCPEGWDQFENFCYHAEKPIGESLNTWQDASDSCGVFGADLLSIHSPEEQYFVEELVRNEAVIGQYWSGLNKLEDKNGDLKWSDGTSLYFSDWAPNEPDSSGLELCVYVDIPEAHGDCFTQYDGRSTIQGILDSPEDATPPDTFHFGGKSEDEEGIEFCKEECGKVPECYSYTFTSIMSPDSTWNGQCVGRSDAYDIDVPDIWCYSGTRVHCKTASGGSWHSSNCGVNLGYICKKPERTGGLTTTTEYPLPVESYCPEGFTNILQGDKCFKVVSFNTDIQTQGSTWFEAVDICRSQAGYNPDIASVHSAEENAEIMSSLRGNVHNVWLGHYRNNSQWLWADNSEPVYDNWENKTDIGLDVSCAEMRSTQPEGTWVKTNCNQHRGYVCQTFKDPNNPITKPPNTTPFQCRSGWTPYWYSCYMMLNQTLLLTWQDAEEYCVGQGGHLLSIHSAAENSAIFATASGKTPIWIGLHKAMNTSYQWSDGWILNYFNWADTISNETSHLCVNMDSKGLWYPSSCNETHYFGCKYSEENALTTPVHIEGSCPDYNWHLWGEYCYLLVMNSTSWPDAHRTCMSHSSSQFSSDLVSIHSYPENHMIVNELKKNNITDSWIGLYHNTTNSAHLSFHWSDQSQYDLQYWNINQPNGSPQVDQCTEISSLSEAWQDTICSERKSYVCKTKISVSSNVTTPIWNVTTTPPTNLTTTTSASIPQQPQFQIIMEGNFSSSTGDNFTEDCVLKYAASMNQRVLEMSVLVNSKIGELCPTFTQDDMKILSASSPMQISGALGRTLPTFYFEVGPNVLISDVEDCGNSITVFLQPHHNWGEPILPTHPGCPGVNFNAREFNHSNSEWLCLDSTNSSMNKMTSNLNYAISHTGDFHTEHGEILDSQCFNTYNTEFTAKTFEMVQNTNSKITSGELCTGHDITILTGSAFLVVGQTQGVSSQNYILQLPPDMILSDIYSCAGELSSYLSHHGNWITPIIPQAPGCPTLVFDPEIFKESDQKWICVQSSQENVRKGTATHSQAIPSTNDINIGSQKDRKYNHSSKLVDILNSKKDTYT